MPDNAPDRATLAKLRDFIESAVWLVEIGGGTEQERAEFRRRKVDLLTRLALLLPPEDES
jgi:hypothetical protein